MFDKQSNLTYSAKHEIQFSFHKEERTMLNFYTISYISKGEPRISHIYFCSLWST